MRVALIAQKLDLGEVEPVRRKFIMKKEQIFSEAHKAGFLRFTDPTKTANLLHSIALHTLDAVHQHEGHNPEGERVFKNSLKGYLLKDLVA